ncbi:MAG TPA: extracellular solute-binding protein [Acidimicrobiales bacterium]|jgi:sn-glycerol 3-phosphate transport system substrate-binding protein|nr:extracellular solute-binding protein [Acidimicrobiales bacterium]
MQTTRLCRLAAAALFVTTLSGTAASAAVGSAPAGAASLPTCNLKALANTKGVVNITFWESASTANLPVLQTITDGFNASQTKVHVTLVTQSGTTDTWQKYTAGLSNGQLPDVVQLADQQTQSAVDTQSFLPVQSCMNASKYPTADYLPRPLAYWKVNGVQWALPFAVSAPILFYNQNAFTKAGLNAARPPTTLPALVADSKALKASGSGMALVLDPWHLETWLATANQLFVNNKNGRSTRATKGVFVTKTAVSIFNQLRTMVRSGYATTNPSTGPDAYDNLLGIGSGKYGMTIETSAALGAVTQLLGGGKYANVKLGIGAFPAYSASARGGIEPGGSGIYISNKSSALEQAASWQYVSYLMNTQSQATWAAGTGYIPVRKSSARTATVQKLWATNPGYKVAYTEVSSGPNTPATTGSVIGPYTDVRTDVLNAEISMYTQGVSAAAAVKAAEQSVNSTIAGYNGRL